MALDDEHSKRYVPRLLELGYRVVDKSNTYRADPKVPLVTAGVNHDVVTNEVRLDSPVAGDSSFTWEFAARGPFDRRGRSLRQFDLQTRIFKYPCSYLIYSETFDAIPQPAKRYVYRRLFEVLSGGDQSPEFNTLSAEDRLAILEILVDTKPGFAGEWKQWIIERARRANRQPETQRRAKV